MYCLTNKKQGFSLRSALLLRLRQRRLPDINFKPYGFSLIELLVVISLFTITSIAVTVSYVSFANKEQVKNGALLLKSDLRSAQSKAISGDKVSNNASGCQSTVGGSGTALSTTSLAGWYLTMDLASNTTYSVKGMCLDSGSSYSENFVGVKNITLPSGVYISCIKYATTGETCGTTHTKAYVVFRPLDNTVYFFDQTADAANLFDSSGNMLATGQLIGAPGEIVFTVSDGTNNYEVHVGSSGNISEKQCPCT